MNFTKIDKPFNFILFGASGDLAQLKLFPSLYQLILQKRFKKNYSIVGFSRTKMTDEQFRVHIKKSLKAHIEKSLYNEDIVHEMLKHCFYCNGQYDNLDSYDALADKINKLHKGRKVQQLVYLSVPPLLFSSISRLLAMTRSKLGSVHIMMEKPFGDSRKTAGDLFKMLTNDFDPKSLYLIDHYLGKAPVQSILPLRFNNTILNLLLKGSAISNIQISAQETVGVNNRLGYFEKVGIIKDMVQSHLLQVLALLTMAMPVKNKVFSIQREKGNILSAIRYYKKDCSLVIGQYESYKKQKGVSKTSITPTFAAFKCYIDLMEWYSVPIYIRTGKKLSHKHTYVVIEFKKPSNSDLNLIETNRLIIELYPHEQIQIRLVNEQGQLMDIERGLISSESLSCTGDHCLPDYAKLILDALCEDHTHFLSIDEIYASWHFIDDLMEASKKQGVKIVSYKDGGGGPKEHFDLIKRDGFKWFEIN